MGKMIEIRNLTKSFKGQIVLNGLSFSAEPGSITGIIGRNGSGKTVLFKCMCGFLLPDSGQIIMNNKDVTKIRERNGMIGAIIEEPGFLDDVSGYKNLKYLALLQGKIGEQEILHALEQVGLLNERNKKVKKYSMGMRQRLGIAQVLMEDPPVMILDEPMNGLDQQGVEDMWNLFLDLKKQNKTVILTSHNKEDIDILCDAVYRIDNGILTKER
ncbi:MAG: ABC transporter ATP-binding protein [Eubacteriales bacterium]|nr:ABC transporter ATP-binding protein [Eubacteriales bacterium]